jgi:uncharacterized protein (TIGR02466 family)
MIQLLQLFATPIYISKLEITNDQIEAIVINQQYEKMHSGTGSYTVNQRLLNLEELKSFKEEIDRHVMCYAYDILKIKQSQKFYLTNSWAVKLDHGDYANPHIHTNSLISGVFYLSGDNKFGRINFGRTYDNIFTSSVSPDFEEYNPLNSSEYSISPEKNMLLLFPSITNHSVSPNLSNDTRYSIAFNYFIEGTFGRKETNLSLSRDNSSSL